MCGLSCKRWRSYQTGFLALNRMKQVSSFLILIITLLLPRESKSQQAVADTIRNRFEQFQQYNLQEKIFVHLDRTSYVTGETMWLKVYCVDAVNHRLLDVSKVAYIEILSREGKSLVNAKIELSKGEGVGSLFIPATLDSDNYLFRAYTNWMKNFPDEFFFQQSITIVNPFRKNANPSVQTKQAIDAQFFPEGGTLIEGINSKVAFRIAGQNGLGMSCRGSIINSSNDTVARFSTERFGLGHFSFTPTRDSYHAIVIDETGKKLNVTFPEVQPSGYALQLRDAGENLQLTVRAVGKPESSVVLVGHTRGRIFSTQQLPLVNGATSFRIPIASLGEGISHFTLFDEDLRPVCERLFYKKPNTALQIKATTDQKEYGQRRTVKLSIDLAQKNSGNKVSASIAVHKQDSIEIIDEIDIATNLLLTSDLSGHIEAPQFYLEKASTAEFDNLMLTHGWRRFLWDQINDKKGKVPNFLPEVDGPILSGTLHDENGAPASNIPTFLTTSSSIGHIRNFVSGNNGEVRFVLNGIKDETKLYLQTDFNRDSTFVFKMTNTFAPVKTLLRLPALSLSAAHARSIMSRSLSMQVQDIYADKNEIAPAARDTIPFYGKGDETYYLDDYTRFPVMEEVMREYVKGVWVRKRQGKFYFIVVDNVNKSIFRENPLVLLDGVRMFNVDQIMALDPRLVKRIDVVTGSYYLGMATFPGIISYHTYKGDMAGLLPHRKTLVLEYEGLQVKREFFSPVYQTERQRSSRMPDQRSVLAWIPYPKVVDGKTEIEFFTSDVSGTFTVSIQALGSDGSPASTKTSFTVSNFNN